MRLHYAVAAACAWAAASTFAAPGVLAADAATNIADSLAHYGRPHGEILADGPLKTEEVLTFGGVTRGMITANILPGAGYYTRILATAVGPNGAVYAMVPVSPGQGDVRRGPKVDDLYQGEPTSRLDLALAVEDQPEWHNITTYWEPFEQMFAAPKQVDFTIAAGAYHVLKGSEFPKLDMAAFAKNLYDGMNNGGIYLVIDNAAAKGTGFSAASTLNRVEANAVKAEVTSAGFVLDGESTLLANSKDNHSKAATPGDGSDMFILRFKKPMDAANTDMRPANPVAALAGYFGNTRRGNVGARLERRVMYHDDMTYEEYGALETKASPFQSGIIFYRADGQGCMLHKFPARQRAQVNCSNGRAVPYMKTGSKWNGAEDNRPYWLVPGYVYFESDKYGDDK